MNMNRLNNVVHVVKGASGSGKSWVCESLTGVSYVRFDDSGKDCHERIVLASKSNLPVVTDPNVVTANMKELFRLPNSFACYYIIAEPLDVVRSRIELRGGSMTESLVEKVAHYARFKGTPSVHVGTSTEIREIIQRTVSSKFWTYGIYEDSSGQLVYVGKAKNNGSRFANHACSIAAATKGSSESTHKAMYRYFARRLTYGDNFTLKIVGATDDELEAYELESRLIFEHRDSRTLFNVDAGGNGPRGSFKVVRREVSKETRDKLSEARKGLKFDVGYANRGCWRLSDDEVEIICGDRGVDSIDKDDLGRVKLSDDEVESIRRRRNLVKYHQDSRRRSSVLAWHKSKSDQSRLENAAKLGLAEVPKRITHLAALSPEARKERRLKLASLHRKRRLAEDKNDRDTVSKVLEEIRIFEDSLGVEPVNTSVRSASGYRLSR